MRYFAYIIQSLKDESYYTGSSEDLDIRISKHNRGCVKSTKNKRPYKLVYKEEFLTRQEAYKRERQIKSYKGGEAFKKLIRVDTKVVNWSRL